MARSGADTASQLLAHARYTTSPPPRHALAQPFSRIRQIVRDSHNGAGRTASSRRGCAGEGGAVVVSDSLAALWVALIMPRFDSAGCLQPAPPPGGTVAPSWGIPARAWSRRRFYRRARHRHDNSCRTSGVTLPETCGEATADAVRYSAKDAGEVRKGRRAISPAHLSHDRRRRGRRAAVGAPHAVPTAAHHRRGTRPDGWAHGPGRHPPADGRERTLTFGTALFEGTLEVTDVDALWRTFEAGIGPGRAFGCGLLSIVPK